MSRERGSGTGLSAFIVLGLAGAVMLGVWLLGWVQSVRRAHDVADLAALAGAHAHATGRDACRVARETAAANRGELRTCEVKGGPASFVVEVQVAARLRPALERVGVPKWTTATAAAGNG